jgi:trehalose utilization protein
MTINVTIYNEFIHEQKNETVRKIYPDGIHTAIANLLGSEKDFVIRTATLEEPEHGLTDEVLNQTDVLLWWGHIAHDKVSDEVVTKVQHRVLKGMGLIVLHSGHYSKIFKRLMGTDCGLIWREADERERIWIVNPAHPITQGLDRYFEIPQAEMYGEFFDIPDPDELIFISWFEGGEVFRSGATWRRGQGKIFYFRPGHETYPIYHMPVVGQVLVNAVRWANFAGNTAVTGILSAPNANTL